MIFTQQFPHPQKPSRLQKFGLVVFRKLIQKWKKGGIELLLPHGEKFLLGSDSDRVQVQIKDYRFFNEILFEGDIGFGKAYMLGYWDTDQLTKLLSLFTENQNEAEDHGVGLSWLGELFQRWGHKLRANTLKGSQKNIHAHYDLGNDFYRLFLDPTMSYSCAIYTNPQENLEKAQHNKIQRLLQKLRLQPSDHLLEIGTGWGTLAIEATKTYGCQVTSVTISKEQFKFAKERIKQENLEHKIEIRFQDYRTIQGQYDKIVSVEMLEAVGHEHLPVFFKRCDEILRPNGLLVLQVISMVDQKYEQYRKSCDWIQKYIFPGSLLPSLTILTQTMTKASRFMVEHLENIGIHYAQTLREWNQRFQANWSDIEKLGFDEQFRRKWEYYFCYCEAGFQSRAIGDLQLVLTRSHNNSLPQIPGTEF